MDDNVQPEDSAQKETEQTEKPEQEQQSKKDSEKASFADGLAVGLGIGSIASFAIVWVSPFFSPLLPQSATYESLWANFIYPLIYLL